MESDGEGVADVEAAPKIKKKIVKGPAENKSKKEHINVVFIGHVGTLHRILHSFNVSTELFVLCNVLDAGKSTIGGQIMYLTGMVDKRTLEKYEKEAREKNRESWYLSWALDTNLEGNVSNSFFFFTNFSVSVIVGIFNL